MKKFFIIISMMLFLVPGLGYALPWSMNDALTISWGTLVPSYSPEGGSGGLATITNTTKNETIKTFCIELDEYTSYSQFVYNANTNTATLGGRNTNSGDPLSGSTKWLYSKYLTGDAGYQNVGAMALAIWYLEDEYWDIAGTPELWRDWYTGRAGNDTLANAAYNYIKAAQGNSSFDSAQIFVLNTYNGSTVQGQSFIYPVPEPGILILLGIALSAVGLASRRYKF